MSWVCGLGRDEGVTLIQKLGMSEEAADADLEACCEGPRTWYVKDDEDLRRAFSAQQIHDVTTGS